MCHISPFYRFEVTGERLDKALAALAAAGKVLSNDQAFEVFFELGFEEAVTFTEEGKLELDLTELQYVAAAAAITAVAETRGKQVLNESRS